MGAYYEYRPTGKAKWCSYCRKDDHDDAECWCTRAIPAPAVAYMPMDALRAMKTPDHLLSALERALRETRN